MAPSVQYWGRWLSSDSILLPPFLFLCRRLAGPVFYAASCSFHTCPIPLHLDRRGLHLRCQLCSGFSVFAVGGGCMCTRIYQLKVVEQIRGLLSFLAVGRG